MGIDYAAIRQCLEKESRVVRLPDTGQAVFVGDTHGDVDTTREVLARYFKPGYTLVFLGDYVDRGRKSLANLTLLLRKKQEAPERLVLLMGNHECYRVQPFVPADFWGRLSESRRDCFAELLSWLPYAAWSSNGLLAVHGVPPVSSSNGSLVSMGRIELGSGSWKTLVWGDFTQDTTYDRQPFAVGGRPQFNEAYFNNAMRRLDCSVLVRGHQVHAPQVLFGNRCLTLITSRACLAPRRIAIADLEADRIATLEDLQVISLD
jgi:hypothetical protein